VNVSTHAAQSGRIYFVAMDRTFIDRLASESDHRRAKEIAQAALDGQTTVLEAGLFVDVKPQ
jgi:hypothetical protein